ncbi:[citrate (pro-3S)-lyase] ligase [Alloiococcus sp. CFN-8]|uniref:[citrate (pro-3S)-lyase] ligase n=1 Tax=Alloiococcus sp. CFN-8 TaxID=3416081 RepID=UPI003CF9C765
MVGITINEVNIKNPRELQEIKGFLKDFSLTLDKDIDYTLSITEDGRLIATCSKEKNILKSFAILPEYQGEGLAAVMVTRIMDKLLEEGHETFFVFTKPCNKNIFISLGFSTLYEGKDAVLLENGLTGIEDYLKKIIKSNNIDTLKSRAAIVMNCNPFTLGHRFLIEKAAEENEEVIIFLVEEDKSFFPFNIRYTMLKEGTKDIPGVKLISGGKYIISSATFPNYFIKEENQRLRAYAEIDAGVFYRYIAKALNIKKRYVGEEPYCNITSQYNEALKAMAKEYEVELIEVPRRTMGQKAISASSVRGYLASGDIEKAFILLPATSAIFLKSPEGIELIEKLKRSHET